VKQRFDLLVAAAVPLETEILRGRLTALESRTVGHRSLVTGVVGDLSVGVLTTGVGKANAAMAIGAALEVVDATLLLVCGIGGAYPGSGLSPGELAVASEEIYGDEGAETPDGLIDFEEIGIPLWEDPSMKYFNRFPVDRDTAAALIRAAGEAVRTVSGPFVTVSTVTGSRDRAADLERRFGAVCESMEGAAAAHAAAVWGVAFAEIRGISNAVGPRDRSSWRIEKAASEVQEAVIRFVSGRGRER